MSQLVAILASKNQNVNILKRDFVNLGTIKILFLKWQEFFKEPPLKPLKDFVEIGIELNKLWSDYSWVPWNGVFPIRYCDPET